MPIYEYHCEPCKSTFETLVRTDRDVPECPTCGSNDLEKQFSVPASAKSNGSSLPMSAPMMPMGGCGPSGCGAGMCGMGG